MKFFTAAACATLAFLFACTGGDRLAGSKGGSETTNSLVACITHRDGTPAAGSVVRLRKTDYLSQPGMLAKRAASVTDTVFKTIADTLVDTSGRFEISSIAPGSYCVEIADTSGNKAQNGALLFSFTIGARDSIYLGSGSLQPYATIAGTVDTAQAGQEQLFVQIRGLERLMKVGASGFTLSDLPAGYLNLRIVKGRAASFNREIFNIKTLPSDTVKVKVSGSAPFSGNIYLTTMENSVPLSDKVIDFPLLIRLDSLTFDFAKADPTGKGISFVKKDDTPLSFEIEQWDSADRNASIWVRMDTVYNSPGQYIVMKWGDTLSARPVNGAVVFDTALGFLSAYHFNGNINDATQNGHNGVDHATVDSAGGIIGHARGFDGMSQYIDLGDLPDRESGMISCWFRPSAQFDSTTQTTQGIWGKFTTVDQNCNLSLRGVDFFSGFGADGSINSKFEVPDTGFYLASKTASFSAGEWYYVSWTWGKDVDYLYVNGALEDSVQNSVPVTGKGSDLIGRCTYDTLNIDENLPRYFSGTIDEFRIEKKLRSADWVRLCYLNQRLDAQLVQMQLRKKSIK
jgi:hypothetical protein